MSSLTRKGRELRKSPDNWSRPPVLQLEFWRKGLRFMADALIGPKGFPSAKDVLFIASPSDIVTPSETGLRSQHLDRFIFTIQQMGLGAVLVLRPNTGRIRGKTSYKVSSFPRLGILRFLGILSRGLMGGGLISGKRLEEVRDKLSASRPDWKMLLQHVSPRIVIGIGLSDDLCKAARELSIPTVEVQHGFFVDMPPYWQHSLPDYFFAWDYSSAEKATEAGHKGIVAGHPLDHERGPISSAAVRNGKPLCCVALSWDEQDTSDRFGSMSPEVLSAARHLQGLNVTLVVRLHPVMTQISALNLWRYKKEILRLLPNSIIHNPTRISLADTVSLCSFALTHSSSIAFDFAVSGKASIVIEEHAREALAAGVNRHGLPKALIKSIESLDQIGTGDAPIALSEVPPDISELVSTVMRLS